jgi:hypothetical protein
MGVTMSNLKRAWTVAVLVVSTWIVLILAIYGAVRIAERILG